MSDSINKQDAIKAVSKWMQKEFGYLDLNRSERLIDTIEALPSADRPIGWIPVSERLPKTGDSILVTYSDEEVGIVWSARSKVWGKYEKANNLIFPVAWMPLPEPYKAESEDKE